MSDFRSSFNLVDIFCKLYPRSRDVSWFNSDRSIGIRLDKFFVSSIFVNSVQSTSFSPCCFSDHDYVNLCLTFDDNAVRGPGLWKFNNSLLSDNTFCDFIFNLIDDFTNCFDYFSSARDWWDFFKASPQSEIIAFSKEKRRLLNFECVQISNRLISCKQRLVLGDNSASSEIATLESRLKALILKDLEGVKTRSRVQWLEEGEKPARFFFKLERERAEKNFVSSILDDSGHEVSLREDIKRAHVNFYTDLFSPEAIDDSCTRELLDSVSRTLSPADRELC